MQTNLIALQNKFLGQGQTVYDKLSNIFEEQGYIADADIESLANEFNLPKAHIRSTAKFYDELSTDAPAKHTIKICNGEACQATPNGGCHALQSTLESKLNLQMGQTNPDGVRLEHVACLGYCSQGPNAMINGDPVSLSSEAAVQSTVNYIQGGQPLDLTEPVNPVYPPAPGQPNILMRHFNQPVVELDDARAAGIYKTLEHALTSLTPQQVIDEVKASQIRGRGGAGFPAGIKFQTVADAIPVDGSGRKFVAVNFDEGDAGSYIDKELSERDPHTQLEGMLLAAYAVGASQIYIYTRFEYPTALKILQKAVDQAKAANFIGQNILSSNFSCEITVVRGQGAYICGEETSLLRSLEGVPALVSFKPPFPAQQGLFNCPTLVNNTETIHNLSWIIQNGGEKYAKLGYEKSRGTKAISLNARVKNPGMYEVELGITLRQIIFDLAGGMADGQTFKAVQIGGPLGGILPESQLDTPLDFEALDQINGILGHAGIVVYSNEDDLVKIARNLMAFCAIESCGKCFPCRIGAVRGTELFDQMIETGITDDRLNLLTELCETMKFGSLCALGGMIPLPIECLIQYFPDELNKYRQSLTVPASANEAARQETPR